MANKDTTSFNAKEDAKVNATLETAGINSKPWLDPKGPEFTREKYIKTFNKLPAEEPIAELREVDPSSAGFIPEKYIDAFDKEMQEHFSGHGYEHLSRILGLAHSQSSAGKGKQRHATGPTGFKPWDRQPILEISRMVGPGYAAGQAMKKTQEAVTMAGNKNFSAAKAEALGAIVYAAALYKLLEEME
jgi:hypothetical protein